MRHRQLVRERFDLRGQPDAGASPRVGQRASGRQKTFARCRVLALELVETCFAALELRELLSQRVAAFDAVLQRRPVLAFHSLEQRQTVFHLLEAFG